MARWFYIFSACLVAACGGGGDATAQRTPAPPVIAVNASYVERTAGDEPYLLKCNAGANRILLVLHSWPGEYHEVITDVPGIADVQQACIVSPNFGGPNSNPQALGSDDSIDRIQRVLRQVKRETGLSVVHIQAASGGGMAAMNYMGKYPGEVSRASLWYPVYDLASLYATTSIEFLRTDMVSVIGRPPVSLADPDYAARSPSLRLNNATGPGTVHVHFGTFDTVTLPDQGKRAAAQLQARGYTVTLREWPTGHGSTDPEVDAELLRELQP